MGGRRGAARAERRCLTSSCLLDFLLRPHLPGIISVDFACRLAWLLQAELHVAPDGVLQHCVPRQATQIVREAFQLWSGNICHGRAWLWHTSPALPPERSSRSLMVVSVRVSSDGSEAVSANTYTLLS